METLKCPGCGSNDFAKMGPLEYKCTHCGTSFMLNPTQMGFVDVVLLQAGNNKINVIKALREVTTDEPSIKMMDLAMAKRAADSPPGIVASKVTLEVGERVKAKLEKAGAAVELKSA